MKTTLAGQKVTTSPEGRDVSHCGLPLKVSEMVGAYLAVAAPVRPESVVEAFRKVFGNKGRQLLDLNIQALHKGAEAALAGDSHILAAA